MSSKADDFDVRYRDTGTAEDGRPEADGGYRGNAGDVDYDLGYDAEGWDTQGFRRPDADYLDSHEPGPTSRHGQSRWRAYSPTSFDPFRVVGTIRRVPNWNHSSDPARPTAHRGSPSSGLRAR